MMPKTTLDRTTIVQRALLEVPYRALVRLEGPLAMRLAPWLGEAQVVHEGVADVAFVDAPEVSAGGGLSVSVPSARRVVALVDLARGAKIVDESADPASVRARATRLITSIGVIDVTSDGLMIREVPKGLSARDAQRMIPVLLRAGPDLGPLRT